MVPIYQRQFMEDNQYQNNEEVQVFNTKVFNFADTTSTKKIFALNKRIRAVAGGTSASKTISILVWLIDYCQQKQGRSKLVSVVSESHPHLEKGAILDFKNIMRDRGYWKDIRWNDTKHTYTFETGNKIEFYSVDTYGKAHGPRRDVLFINEANNLSYKIVDQLITRTREVVFLDWNPSEEFWFYTQMLGKRDDIDFITLNYKDNEALDAMTIHEIESHKWDEDWWNTYGLGKLGKTKTRIYPAWEQIDDVPEEARLKVKGLDFGYANDPTALIDIYEWNGGYILDEQLYEKGLMNNQIAKAIGRKTVITIGDSAEPKSVAEIAMHGVNIIGSKKGKGSVSQGIDAVKSKKIYVTKRSLNIIKENRNYIYVTDKDGNITNEPRDLFNHAMDAVRYAIAFLNPVVEKDPDEEELQMHEYETPGIYAKESAGMPQSTIQPFMAQGTHKQRMQAILDRKKQSSSYQTDTPWQPPGV